MKRIFFISLFLLCSLGAGAIEIERMDPPFWYSGMKNHELQIMFYGKDIANSQFVLEDYEGVSLKEVCRMENPPM